MKVFCFFVCALFGSVSWASPVLSGELKKWHKITLACPGPATSETATPNPFTDFRFNAVFSHPDSGKIYTVPGYYAADGNAAQTSANGGNVWHVHFSPDETGTWNYSLTFRAGAGIAVDTNPSAGISAGHFDAASGSFEILPGDKTGSDLRAKGRLEYVGKHHLRFAETGEYFMKCGTDSPENLLAYDDFDGTPDVENRTKSWTPHAPVADGPVATEVAPFTWQEGKGSELLGAINYLAEEGLNAFSFLTFSLDGDDENVFPHLINAGETFGTGTSDGRWAGNKVHHLRFDVSKLAQWERVFEYATSKGMHLNFKTQEVENDELMDGGELGIERKLYYRELVARFGHHLALNWNLGEENTNSRVQRIAFAQWFHDNDPYRHPVVMHTKDNGGNDDQNAYLALLGNLSKLTGASLQPADDEQFDTVFPDTKLWVTHSFNAGKPWVVACDEPGHSGNGLMLNTNGSTNHVQARKNALWANPMAGGAGLEWYFGGSTNNPDTDTKAESFLSRSAFWPYCKHMLDFWKISGAPFWKMVNDDGLIDSSNGHCLAKDGEQYVIYLKSGGTTNLNLDTHAGTFDVLWYDPRNGGFPSTYQITGGTTVNTGNPPSNPSDDWVALVRKSSTNAPPVFPGVMLSTDYQTAVTLSLGKILFLASDPEQHTLTLISAGPTSARGGTVTLGSGVVYTPAAGFHGKDVFPITIRDSQNAAVSGFVTIIVSPPLSGGGSGANPPVLTMADDSVAIRFQGIPGEEYVIQRSVDLVFWQTIHTKVADGTGTLEHVDLDPPSPTAFYRLNQP